MKKIYSLGIALLLVNALVSQSCLPDGLYISSQSEIDNFKANYPNCTQIEGHLEISGNGITNLDSLHMITYIGGFLDIYSVPDLVDISGLSALTTVGSGRLGLSGSALTNLNGLENLTSVAGLRIEGNTALSSLQGLASLTTAGEGVYILENPVLESLNGLESLTSAGQGGFLIIESNASLVSLSGIDNIIIDPLYQIEIYIRYNPLLSECDVESLCGLLDDNGIIYLENNAEGCNTMDEIKSECGTSVDELFSGSEIFIYPNPASSLIIVDIPSGMNSSTCIEMNTLSGQEIMRFQTGQPINEIDIGHLPAGIYVVKIRNDENVMVQKVVKQ